MDNDRLIKLAGIDDPLMAAIRENAKILDEAVDMEGADLGDLERMMDGARRGMGLANRLRDPVYKRQHLSRIMGNMNRIRAALQRMIRQLETETSQESAY